MHCNNVMMTLLSVGASVQELHCHTLRPHQSSSGDRLTITIIHTESYGYRTFPSLCIISEMRHFNELSIIFELDNRLRLLSINYGEEFSYLYTQNIRIFNPVPPTFSNQGRKPKLIIYSINKRKKPHGIFYSVQSISSMFFIECVFEGNQL